MNKDKNIVSKKPFKLIHTALFSEAKPIIDKLELRQYDTKPFKVFKNNNIVLIVSGIGKENTIKALEKIFNEYNITKAINIGTAGCSDKSRHIGELFCTNHKLNDIKYLELTTVKTPKTFSHDTHDSQHLYDMEGNYFLQQCKIHLNNNDIYILKVISDHLDDTIPKKEFVYKIIRNSIEKWYNIL